MLFSGAKLTEISVGKADRLVNFFQYKLSEIVTTTAASNFHRNSNAENECMIPSTVLKWLLNVLYWESTMWTSKLKQFSEIG